MTGKVECPICCNCNAYPSHFELEKHLDRDHTKASMVHVLIRKYITGETRHG